MVVHEVFRPLFGRVLTGGLAVAAVGIVAWIGFDDGPADALRTAPFLASFVFVCGVCFWRPRVEVDDAGVTLVNVTRTVRLPWPSIQLVDTKWTLSLVTAYGRFDAWAAPAPGARMAMLSARAETRHAASSARTAQGIRPGDLPSTESGAAAELIRRHWERLRDEGHLDDARLEHERVPMRWHVDTLVAAVVLIGLCVVSASIG